MSKMTETKIKNTKLQAAKKLILNKSDKIKKIYEDYFILKKYNKDTGYLIDRFNNKAVPVKEHDTLEDMVK